MTENYNETCVLTAQLDKQCLGSNAVSVERIEKGVEAEKILSTWEKYKLTIITCAATVAAGLVIALAFLIFLPKASQDLKNHKNYSKFSKNSCALNQTSDSPKYPWLVRIVRKNLTDDVHSCVAFLIADNLLLTAAHCLEEEGELKISEVHLSDTFGNNFNKIIPRRNLNLIPHEDFSDNRDAKDDIGLIKISQALPFTSSFYPACLPFESTTSPNSLALIQWSSQNISSTFIDETEIVAMDADQCQIEYTNIGSDENIQFYKDKEQAVFCVDSKAEKTRRGDSGSPAILSNNISAVVYAILTGGENESNQLPDLYVTVHAHLKWILDNA